MTNLEKLEAADTAAWAAYDAVLDAAFDTAADADDDTRDATYAAADAAADAAYVAYFDELKEQEENDFCGYCKGSIEENLMHCPICD
jgi:hypothetical protein